jgi:hypothetical protein
VVAALARLLLADAEVRKDAAQQVIRGDGAGYFAERLLRQPQLFGKNFACAILT